MTSTANSIGASAPAGTRRKFAGPAWAWGLVLAVVLVLTIRSDVASLRWVEQLSQQGGLPPEREAHSPTGYALGQRQFLGAHRRGETYRWIAATQELIVGGPFASSVYRADTPPEGRPRLLPRIYALWLAGISWSLHVLTGEPIAIAVEHAALWEPVISHVLAFIAAVVFMGRRFGPIGAGLTGLLLALFPPFFGQFLPGALTTDTWALLFAAHAIALNLPAPENRRASPTFGIRAAVVASLALWLDPAFGFSAVVIAAVAGVVRIGSGARLPFLSWSLAGFGAIWLAWLIDRNPWSPAAGELRYVHPLYALTWLGIGLGLDGWQNLRSSSAHRKLRLAEMVAAVLLMAALVYVQLHYGFKGWLYTSGEARRLTSVDEGIVYNTVVGWLAQGPAFGVALVCAPVLAATAMLAAWLLRRRNARGDLQAPMVGAAVVFATVLAFAFFKVRWVVVASLVALPLIGLVASRTPAVVRRTLAAVSIAFLIGLLVWTQSLPAGWRRESGDDPARPADLQALIYRHFAHWLASHNPGRETSVLAPPELSDSLVFHGGCRVLMSTAWESYPGLVAASRILSSPETTEAEAVLQSRGTTHVVLPSWDRVFPMLAQEPSGPANGKDTLYARLQRWILPRYLRPIPYHLPPVPGFLDQKLAVFEVTPPQDEALALSRLAEYFVEMDRPEPAGLAARVLAESYPQDPNAAIARATVYVHARKQAEFEHELAVLAADASAGRAPFSWDRRVQRAIVLALGSRFELARTEMEACVAAATESSLFDLTALQAHRLKTLAARFGLSFPSPELAGLLAARGAEYARPSDSEPGSGSSTP